MILPRVIHLAVAGAAGAAAIASLTGCGSSGGASSNATPATLLAAGIQLQEKGDLDGAKQLYDQVIAKDPNNLYAHFDLGLIAQTKNDVPTALREYGQALVVNPNYVPALYNEALIYTNTDPSLAILTYRQVIKVQPGSKSATSYLNLGLLEEKAGQHARATQDLLTALHLDPSLSSKIPKALLRRVGQAASKTSPTPSASASASPAPSTSASP